MLFFGKGNAGGSKQYGIGHAHSAAYGGFDDDEQADQDMPIGDNDDNMEMSHGVGEQMNNGQRTRAGP